MKHSEAEIQAHREAVDAAASGRWAWIFSQLAPALAQAVGSLEKPGNPRHVPCPRHGGKDGFRFFRDSKRSTDDTGCAICNTCGYFPHGFKTLMWVNGWDWVTAHAEVERLLGMELVSNHVQAPKPLPARVVKREEKSDEKEDEKLRLSLNRVWNESIQICDRDAEPARLYFARRGISISPPESLRFHPSLSYYDGKEKVGEYPAIISMVSGATGNAVTIHRIYLTQDGNKAPVKSPKKLMSYPSDRKIIGGAIRVSPASKKSSTLLVAEGVETTVAVMEGTEETEFPVWSTVNALLMENFVPPDWATRVIIFGDKDRPTEQHPKGHGQEAAKKLVQRLWQRGIQASAIIPAGEIPPGEKSLDWLDILKTNGSAGFPVMNMIERTMRNAA